MSSLNSDLGHFGNATPASIRPVGSIKLVDPMPRSDMRKPMLEDVMHAQGMRPNEYGKKSWASLVGSNGQRMPRKLLYYSSINSFANEPIVRFSDEVINKGVKY